MSKYDAVMTTVGMGALGVFIAYIFYYLNDEGIWVDQVITASTTIQDIMAVIILIFLLVGVILGAMRSR